MWVCIDLDIFDVLGIIVGIIVVFETGSEYELISDLNSDIDGLKFKGCVVHL